MQFSEVVQTRRAVNFFAPDQAVVFPDNDWVPLWLAIGDYDAQQTLAAPKWRKTVDEIVVRFD